MDPAQRHCALFLTDVRTLLSVPTLRSFLKLYKSLDTKRLAGLFTDASDKESEIPVDAEEELVQQMMVLKQCSRRVGRVGNVGEGNRGLLEGETITTSDLDFVIDEVTILFPLLSLDLSSDLDCFIEHGAHC